MRKKILYLFIAFLTSFSLISCSALQNVSNKEGNGENAGNAEEINEKESEINGSKNTDSGEENETVNNNVNNTEELSVSDKEEPVEVKIEDISIKVVVIKDCNVRSHPDSFSDLLGTIAKDTVVEATGLSENGWYRFEYEGKIGFAGKGFFQDKESYDKEIAEQKRLEEERQAELLEAQKKAEEEARIKEEEEARRKAEEEAKNAEKQTSNADFMARVVELCNEQRAAYGLAPLTQDASLDACAQVRAAEITEKFDHTRPDGTSCFTVLNGLTYTAAGENIAAGQRSPEEVVNDWMNSEGHRANILNASFTKIGVGYTTGGNYGTAWVQLFTN